MTTGEHKFVCGLPPPGWSCSREPKHEGPCAATQSESSKKSKHVACESYTEHQACFGLYKEQREAIHAWKMAHDAEKHIPIGKTVRYAGAIGGAYTYEFTNTSIGQCVSVRCACGDSIDVSDYDNW